VEHANSLRLNVWMKVADQAATIQMNGSNHEKVGDVIFDENAAGPGLRLKKSVGGASRASGGGDR
jgi:hypothetical protein